MNTTAVLALALLLPGADPETPAPDTKVPVEKGLKYLAEKQNKNGTWSGNNNFLTVNVTSYAGLALLMQGSTLQDGPYAANLRLTVAWFEKIARENGLLVPADDQLELGRELQSHAAALLFLASAYDADGDEQRRKRLKKLLESAVKHALDGQTQRGGWGISAPMMGFVNDETTSTVFMVQALMSADRAGIAVPRAALDKATKFLTDATGGDGGLGFAPGQGGRGNGQQLPTAAGAATYLTLERRPAALPGWVGFTKRLSTIPQGAAVPAREQLNSTLLQSQLATARVVYALGDTGHQALDATVKEVDLLKWTPHREKLHKFLRATQMPDGSWADRFIGPSYNTALALIMLQLDNNYLPAFSR